MGKLPGINHTDAVPAFQKAGFEIIRQSGHIIMFDGRATIVIPRGKPSMPSRCSELFARLV